MKKLMIAAAIVCAAAMSQAATASWTISGVKDPSTIGTESVASLSSGSAYMFFYTSQELADAAVAAIKADFKGNIAKAKYSYDKQGSTAGTFSINKTTVGEDNLPVVTTDLGLLETTKYYAFAVIVNDTLENLSDDDLFYVTNVKDFTTGTGTDGTSGISIGAQGTNSGVAKNWATVGAVPEPTSAMLLLLGVAGLALRRRRA